MLGKLGDHNLTLVQLHRVVEPGVVPSRQPDNMHSIILGLNNKKVTLIFKIGILPNMKNLFCFLMMLKKQDNVNRGSESSTSNRSAQSS